MTRHRHHPAKHKLVPAGAEPPFPGPYDFDGGYAPNRDSVVKGGQATYDGTLVVITLERSMVRKVLPASLRLASSTTGQTQHPIVCMIGNQRVLSAVNGGVGSPIPGAPDYREVIFLVPFVVHAPGTHKWHSFAVRMYLNALGPIVIGDAGFAYAKEPAIVNEAIALPGVTTDVYNLILQQVFSCHAETTGPYQNVGVAPASVPRWPDLQAVFDMPVIGMEMPVPGTICSYWEWELSNAQVAPATARLRFHLPVRAGAEDWVALGPIDNAPDGAVAVRGIRWRLALPPPPPCDF